MRFVLAALAAFFVPISALAGACDDPGTSRQSAAINIGAATTTLIVDAIAGTRIFVCSITATLAGTSPTIVLKQGTKVSTDCDTGAASLTGTMAPVAGSVIVMGYGGDLFVIGPGNQLCGTTAGSGSSFQGIATYIQKK